MNSKTYIWMFLLCFAFGCGDNLDANVHEPDAMDPDLDASPADGSPSLDAPPSAPDAAPINAGTWRMIMRNPGEPLQRRIDAALTGIDLDTCFLNGDDVSACAWDTYTAGASHVDPAFEEREAVLVVDVLGPAVEMLRYRNRILGFYEVLGDGTLGSVPLEWELPEVFGDILTGFASSPPVPADALAPLQPYLQEVYGPSVPVFSTHGLAVFNILADLIPQNPIVFLDNNLLTFHQAIPEVVCAVEDVDDVDALREHSERFAQDLRALFVTHNVRFVNASWGFTIETIRGPWNRVCGTEPPETEVLLAILEAYRPIFDALFNTEGVFTAHASLASPEDEHYPFDQPSPEFPNRLRVGVFQHPGTGVPSEGLIEVPMEWFPLPGDTNDADVWVNSGCDYFVGCREQRPLRLTPQYGMGRVDFPLAQSSFINPVLLGAFVYFRNQLLMEDMDNVLIRDIIDMLVPECAFGITTYCRYIDPLLHEQIDGFHGPLPIGSATP